MEKLLNGVEKYSPSGEIKEDRLRFFMSKVKVWNYEKATQSEYENFSMEDRSFLF